MSADLTTYAGRAKRRPPGASDFTQRLYRLLHEHPEGLTRAEIHEALREGWMETDAYRAYSNARKAERERRYESAGHQGTRGKQQLEHGTPEFRAAAQRWWINAKLTQMCRLRHRTARREGTGESARYFVGERPPKVQGQKSTYVPFNPEESRAVLTATNAEHINRENAKAELLKLLNDKRIKGTTRDGIQAAYDHLCGRR